MLIGKNKRKMGKKALCLIFAFLLSINSFAAVVSDNDGSAFITKAEFDSLKNDFQAQLDKYNSNIDSKIDNAISSYLAGIKAQKTDTLNLMLWGGRTLGLVENEYSRPYVEGTVGGRLDFNLHSAAGGKWYAGNSDIGESEAGSANPNYFKACFHRMIADSVPFKYLTVDVNKTGGDYYFNLTGYAQVIESVVGLKRHWKNADLTQRRDWTIGLCSGVNCWRGPLERNANTYTGNFIQFCEATTRTDNRGARVARGTVFDDHHNEFYYQWEDVTVTSEPTIDNTYAYVTNASAGESYNGVRTRGWHGANLTNGTTEQHTAGEMHMWGWKVAAARGTKFNFHIDAVVQSNALFNDGAGIFDRIIFGDSSYTGSGWGQYPTSYTHGVVSDTGPFHKLYKADIGGELKSDNLYSNELADTIKDKVQTGLVTRSFDGQPLDVSPLWLGLPITNVKEDDTVEIELELLDNDANYDIGFTVGGFWNQPVLESSYIDSGVNLSGGVGHIATSLATGSSRKIKLKVEIKKAGILFMKYGASGGTSQYIKLPSTCTVTSA